MVYLIALQTAKNIVKDKIFWIILSLILVFGLVPVFSSFSLRQVQEVAITMSLTLNSMVLLFLSVFGGVATIWRDIERKYIYTIFSNPIKRSSFLAGRFLGFAFVMLLVVLLNGVISYFIINFSATMYKSRLPILWINIFTALGMQYLKYLLLMGFGFLFASFSTSFFVPFFATISVYLAGNASQGIYDYILTTDDGKISIILKSAVKFIYYILPNFSAFDFIASATYALKISSADIFYSFIYFCIYFSVIWILTLLIFTKKDFV